MGTTITLILFASACAWAILRTIGAERQRRLQDLRGTSPAPVAQQNPPAAPKPAPPLRKAA